MSDQNAPASSLISTVVIAAAVVASTALLGSHLVRAARAFKLSNQVVVSGSATRRIRSDFVVWGGTVYASGATRGDALRDVGAAKTKVDAYFAQHGVKPADLVWTPMGTETHEGRRDPKTQLLLAGERDTEVSRIGFEIRSSEIAAIEALARDVESNFPDNTNSSPVKYIYTKLADIKVQMAAEAAKDARIRAEQVVKQSGSSLGPLLNARLGVMQINPALSTDVSGEGNNDQTSLDKDVISVVSSTFEVQ